MKARKGSKLADSYIDHHGQLRFKGNRFLKKNQHRPHLIFADCMSFAYQNKPCYHHRELRQYPISFGIQFAKNMKRLRNERSPLTCRHPQLIFYIAKPVLHCYTRLVAMVWSCYAGMVSGPNLHDFSFQLL